MKNVVEHPNIGVVVYEEGFWTGKRQITINDHPLFEVNKKTFVYNDGVNNQTVSVVGNYFKGVKIVMGSDSVEVVKASKWYEYVCSVLIFALVLVWGNSEYLVMNVLPVVGGAIGGLVSGLFTMVNLIAMKSCKKVWLKLVIWLIIFVANIAVCSLIGYAIISASPMLV